MAIDTRIWRYVVGDRSQVGGLLSGARSVYEYYARTSFAPGGIRDYEVEIPVAQSPAPTGAGPISAVVSGAVLPAILGSAARIGDPVRAQPRIPTPIPINPDAEPSSVFQEDEPQPDPESIYANLPPLNPEWQDVDVFGDEPEPSFEEESPPAFIPVDAGVGEPDPLEPTTEEEEPMSSFWDFVNPIIDVAQGQQPGGSNFVGGPYAGPSGMVNAPVQINPRTGRPICKRRRRRRLLTESDFNDLMRIATLPNKQNVTVALAKAVGRR